MIDLRQEELAMWQARNFELPDLHPQEQRLIQCALGMLEEAGEMAHYILKGSQGIREAAGKHGPEKYNVDEVADAFADMVVYGMQVLSILQLDAETELRKTIQIVLQRDWRKDPVKGGSDG